MKVYAGDRQTCSTPACRRKIHAKGFCLRCYAQWRRWGKGKETGYSIYSLDPIPAAHPLVKALLEQIQKDDRDAIVISKKAGISPVTLMYWAHGTTPGIYKFADVAEVVGLKLTLVEKEEA